MSSFLQEHISQIFKTSTYSNARVLSNIPTLQVWTCGSKYRNYERERFKFLSQCILYSLSLNTPHHYCCILQRS